MNQLLVFTLGIILGAGIILVSQEIREMAQSKRARTFFAEQTARFVQEMGKVREAKEAGDTSKPPLNGGAKGLGKAEGN